MFRELTGLDLDSDDAKLRVRPKEYTAYSVSLAGVRRTLAGATSSRAVALAVPDPAGRLVDFQVVEDSVMEPELQAAHPEIRTYAGRAVDGSWRSIRLDVTPMGFHAFVRGPAGTSWFVDPAYNRRGETRHVSYAGAALPAPLERFVERELPHVEEAAGDPVVAPGPNGIVSRRTYKLAFLTDPTYAAYFGTANVFAEKTTLVNRVNEVYNDDLAIKFVMVPGTDTVLNMDTAAKATGAPGPCGANACFTPAQLASCSGSTLDRNEFVLGQLIGAENYDIGHIGLGVNGGGIAGLGVVGGAFKADGCTGLPKPDGDFYAIDYVAHEMGHQMGAHHSFNGSQGNCSPGNRNPDPFTTQVEPGSGSSVMAYAGICVQDNLQPHSDPYFSFVSIDQITATTSAAPGTVDEQQVVNFAGLGAAESFTLSCAGCPTSAAVSITGNPIADHSNISQAVTTATGVTVTPAEISGYDGDSSPSGAGFTVDFAIAGSGDAVKTLTVQPVAGSTFTTFTGTIYNGGPETNQGLTEATTNRAPAVTAPVDKTIPMRTPFTLTGSATDLDGNSLIYLWEQTDAGGATGTALTSNSKTDGPLFRMFGTSAQVSETDTLEYHSPGENLADGNPSRTFPDLAQVLADNTNAETGACPAAPASPTPLPLATLDCYSEFLPTADYVGNPFTGSRVMHFRLTARDRVATGGGTAIDEVALTVNPSAGPFLVTSRTAAGTPADPGAKETVTWSVAGTNTAALATNVKISLSIDGGVTFPAVLAASTPNDGSQQITLPDVNTAKARYKIEAVGNYFFDTNDANFVIGNPAVALDTLITRGPEKNSFVLSRKASFGLAATVAGATFVCKLDRAVRLCSDALTVRLKPGTRVFTAAAKDPTGLVDTTPARRVFSAPFNDRQLKRKTNGWSRHKDKASYRGGWTEARDRGQVLVKSGKRIKKVALVAHTGPGFGTVAVYLGKQRLKTIDLSGRKLRKHVLIKVASLKKGKTGPVRIVTLTDKPVRIDGLGILVKPKS